jgi:hypothetical protein
MKAGSKKLLNYDSYAEQPEWMGLRKGLAPIWNMGRWNMWTARCDQVHRKEDDGTITERERRYIYMRR